MFAGWPVLALLRVLSPMMSPQQRILVRAYYEKSTGAWKEAVLGPRERPFPFRIEDGAQNRA
jgi:hypothetical protein